MYENHGLAALAGCSTSCVLGALGLWLIYRSRLEVPKVVLGLGIPWLLVCNGLLALVSAWG